MISRHLGVAPALEHTGGTRGWAGDSPLIHLDCARIRALGWAPTLDDPRGRRRTLDWFEDNRLRSSSEAPMSVIFTRAPLRISLGGGGTDLPSYYREHGGFLVAGAIDKYVYMLTHTVFQRRYRMKYSEIEEVDDPREIRHPILRETLRPPLERQPLEIASVADVPAGTGLGSSGAFTVCLLKALALARRTTSRRERWPRRRATSRSTCSASRSASRTSTSPRTAASAPTRSTPTARSTSSRSSSTRRRSSGCATTSALLHRRGARGVRAARRPGRADAGAATRRCSRTSTAPRRSAARAARCSSPATSSATPS